MKMAIVVVLCWALTMTCFTQIAIGCDSGEKLCLDANECFDPLEKECCGDHTYWLDSGEACCYLGFSTRGRSEKYNPAEKICCGKKLIDITNQNRNDICCGSDLHNSLEGICCNGKWQRTIGSGVKYECCMTEKYDRKTQDCCIVQDTNGNDAKFKLHERGTDTRCCGLESYDTTKQQCAYGNKIGLLHQGRCGKNTYNLINQLCCQENVVNNPGRQYECCGGRAYNTMTEMCCAQKVHSYTPDRVCCGNGVVDRKSEICCEGHIEELIPGENLTQCCGGELYNSYTSLCCHNQINTVEKGQVASDYKCCGKKVYHESTSKCLHDKIFHKEAKNCRRAGTNCVCNGVEIHKSHLCCFGKPIEKKHPNDNKCCTKNGKEFTYDSQAMVTNGCHAPGKCDGKIYDRKRSRCCDNKIASLRKGNKCCGKKTYFEERQKCKDGRLFRKYKPFNLLRSINQRCTFGSSTALIIWLTNLPQRTSLSVCTMDIMNEWLELLKGFCQYKTVLLGKVGKIRRGKKVRFVLRHLHVLHGRSLLKKSHKLEVNVPRKCGKDNLPEKGGAVVVMTNSRTLMQAGISPLNNFLYIPYRPRGNDLILSFSKENLKKLKEMKECTCDRKQKRNN